MKTKKAAIIITSLLLIISILALAYFFSARSVEVKSINLEDIENITIQGFSAEGDVEVSNNGILPVYVKEIGYSIMLNYSNEKIIEGTVNGSWLWPYKSKNFTILTRVNWIPSIEVAQRIITLEDTSAVLKGEVILIQNKVMTIKFPFQKEFDLTSYFIKFFNKKMDDFIATLPHDDIDGTELFPDS